MSQASNGKRDGGAASIQDSPIPLKAVVHCAVLLSEQELAVRRFLEALPERVEPLGEVQFEAWTVVQEPRECTYTDVRCGAWTFRLIVDPQGLPDSIRSTVLAGSPTHEVEEQVETHKTSCLIFLVEAPPKTTGWERFRALCRVAWAWIDAGATVVAFPEGQASLPRRLLLGIEPDQLTPDHAYLFLSNGLAHVHKDKEEPTYWLRTWGLAQFALPDLAVGLPQPKEAELESLRLLFETLPPAMIREQGVLPVGGQVQVGERVWSAIGPPGPGQLPFLQSRFGVQLFV